MTEKARGPKSKRKPDHYEFITAIVDCDSLTWTYRLKGARVDGGLAHDEDVSDFSKDDIVALTKQILSVTEDDPVRITVEYR